LALDEQLPLMEAAKKVPKILFGSKIKGYCSNTVIAVFIWRCVKNLGRRVY